MDHSPEIGFDSDASLGSGSIHQNNMTTWVDGTITPDSIVADGYYEINASTSTQPDYPSYHYGLNTGSSDDLSSFSSSNHSNLSQWDLNQDLSYAYVAESDMDVGANRHSLLEWWMLRMLNG